MYGTRNACIKKSTSITASRLRILLHISLFCAVISNALAYDRSFDEDALQEYRSDKRFDYRGPEKEPNFKETTLPDGTVERVYENGTKVETKPDGTVIIKSENGVTIEKRTDGTIIKHKPDGDKITRNPDGTIIIEREDGTIISQNEDGTFQENRTDGQVREIDRPLEADSDFEISYQSPSISLNSGLVYLLAFVAIGLIIFFILKNMKQSSKSFSDDNAPIEEEYEDLDSIAFESEIDKYLREKDYRNAIRYYFLESLKALQDKNHIEWKKDKTNADYYYEISDNRIRKEFQNIAFIFDFAWYGNNAISDAQMEYVKNQFSTFHKLLGK